MKLLSSHLSDEENLIMLFVCAKYEFLLSPSLERCEKPFWYLPCSHHSNSIWGSGEGLMGETTYITSHNHTIFCIIQNIMQLHLLGIWTNVQQPLNINIRFLGGDRSINAFSHTNTFLDQKFRKLTWKLFPADDKAAFALHIFLWQRLEPLARNKRPGHRCLWIFHKG